MHVEIRRSDAHHDAYGDAVTSAPLDLLNDPVRRNVIQGLLVVTNLHTYHGYIPPCRTHAAFGRCAVTVAWGATGDAQANQDAKTTLAATCPEAGAASFPRLLSRGGWVCITPPGIIACDGAVPHSRHLTACGLGMCPPFTWGYRMPWLEWHNRNDDLKATAKTPYRLLQPVQSLSYGDEDSPNMLIQGDNLEALKALLPYYAGQVKCIFIDPPYNTRSAFEHYDDNLEHAQWLSMMYPRMALLRELLREDGSIWITLDDNEAHYFKVMCDEVLGRRNFVANLIWEKSDSPRNSARQFSSDHDHLLVYAKNPEWQPKKLPRTEKANSIYTNPDDDPRGAWLPGDPYANKPYSKGQYSIEGPTGRIFSPPPGRYWRVSEEKLRELGGEGRIWWGPKGNARPSIKRYLNEVSDLIPRTLWRKEDVGSNRSSKNEMRALFPAEASFGTPKPEALLQRVIHIATNEGDLVLDSFLGSGTTAAVAHKMGRRWIGIEMGEHARTHCQPRLVKVID